MKNGHGRWLSLPMLALPDFVGAKTDFADSSVALVPATRDGMLNREIEPIA
jgi:hypothetical protein